MKISIDVDLEPSEIPLANELLQTLRLLTEHVKVKRRTSSSGAAAAAPPAKQAANGPLAPVGPPAAAPVLAPVAAPLPAPVQAAPAAPAAAPGPPVPKTPEEARQLFTQLISRLAGSEGHTQLDAVAAEASRLLTASGPVPAPQLVEEFNEALCGVAFDRANITRGQQVDAFLSVLPRLPEAVRGSVKSRTIQWVLGFLNQKRPVDVDRESVYLQADAFAVLVQMDFVAADGTLQTMGKLLKAPEKRMGAVMTMCALAQRCADKLAAANPGFLDSTLNMLASYALAEHRPAVEYVFGQLKRSLPQAAQAPPTPQPVPVPAPQPMPATALQAAAPPPQQQQQQRPPAAAAPPGMGLAGAAPAAADQPPELLPAPANLTVQHKATLTSPHVEGALQSMVFALAYDPYSQFMTSGGDGVPVALYAPDGRLQYQLQFPNMFVSSIHLEPQNRLLMVCGAANDPNSAIRGRTAIFDARPGQNYVVRGNIVRNDMISLAGVDTIADTSFMLVAELVAGSTPHEAGINQVALYDYTRVMASTTEDIQPLQRFIGHSDVVTAIAAGDGVFKEVFLSASKDKTVKLWDIRAPAQPVLTLGALHATHAEMVTCVDMVDYNVMSASLDGSVALWDLRRNDMSTVCTAGNNSPCIRNGVTEEWATNGVVKAAMRGAPYGKLVAAATVKGLYLLDMSRDVPVIKQIEVGDPNSNFCEVKWCVNTGRLLAATGLTTGFEVLECRV